MTQDNNKLELNTSKHEEIERKAWLTDKKSEITTNLAQLKSNKNRMILYSVATILLGLIIIIALILFDPHKVYSLYDSQVMQIVLPIIIISVGVVSLIFSLVTSSIRELVINEELISVNEELELFKFDDIDYEKRAELQFKQHQKELRRYYDINIGHLRLIFPFGISIIAVGICIVIGVILLFKDSAQQNILPIITGCISGLLVDFMGAIFINMYIETIKTSTEFHNKLINSNNNLFANMLITKINDEKLKNEAFAELAKIISNMKH